MGFVGIAYKPAINSVCSTIVITSYKQQKYDIILLRLIFGVWVVFRLSRVGLAWANYITSI